MSLLGYFNLDGNIALVTGNLIARFSLAREIANDMIARHGSKIVFESMVMAFQGGLGIPSPWCRQTKGLDAEWVLMPSRLVT